MLTDSQLIEQMYNEREEWAYVPMSPAVAAFINRVIKNNEYLRASFHDTTQIYEAIVRWDIFRHFRTYLPKKRKPYEGEDYIVPEQIDGSDWRFDRIRGRWPDYWRYCCSRACHWMTVPWLQVVRKMFPDECWQVVSSSLHTGIVSFESKLIFDPYFYACEVPINDAIDLWYGDKLLFDDCEVYAEEEEYSPMDGASAEAVKFWQEVDSTDIPEKQIVAELNRIIDEYDEQEDLGLESNHISTDQPFLNKQLDALNVLVTRGDQL